MVRVKYRYILAEIRYESQRRLVEIANGQVVNRAVRQALKELYGDYGIGALRDSLKVTYLNQETNMVIIRAKREHYRMAQTALTMVKKIGRQDCWLHTLHLGGTIQACQKFLIRHTQRHLPLLLNECTSQDDRERVERVLLNTCLSMEQKDAALVSTQHQDLSEMAAKLPDRVALELGVGYGTKVK